MTTLRYPRTLVSVPLIWGILWASVAVVVGTTIAAIDPSQIDAGEGPIELAPVIGLVGFICGVAFGALLLATGRMEEIFHSPLTRFILPGMVIAAAVPLVSGKIFPEVLVTALLGAVSAAASIAIMQSARAAR